MAVTEMVGCVAAGLEAGKRESGWGIGGLYIVAAGW